MKKLFTLSIAIFCAVAINAQISGAGNGFLEAFDYADGAVFDDVTYNTGLSAEWPEGSAVMAGALKWDQGAEGESWLGFGFENPLDVTGHEEFKFMYQLPVGTALCIYMADADGGESEICPENLFPGSSELMLATIDFSGAEGLNVSKIVEVGFLPYTPTAGTLYLDDITLGDITTVGVSKKIIQSTLNVYPNPASEKFRIDADIKSLSIYNSIGQIVYSRENYLKGSFVNINELEKGLYIIKADDRAQKLMVE